MLHRLTQKVVPPLLYTPLEGGTTFGFGQLTVKADRRHEDHLYWPDQPRFQQRGVFGEEVPRREGDPFALRPRLHIERPLRHLGDRSVALPGRFRRELLVSDQAVRPEVRDPHDQRIPADMDAVDGYPERSLPQR